MPLQLKPPVYDTYTLDEIDQKYGVEGEATTVTVRQATQSQHEQRQKFFARMERKFSPDDDPDEVVIVQELSRDELKRQEVWLTLCDSNMTGENGKALFPSTKDPQGNPRLKMTKHAFDAAWGTLPTDVADAIHARVLELNIQWAGLEGEGF